MRVTPVSFTPNERVAESVVAPVCKVPSSEFLVLSRWSDSSLHKPTASPVVDYDAGESIDAVTPKVFDVLHCDNAPVSHSEYLVVDQDDWFEPVLDATSSEGVLGWRICDYAIPNSKSLNDSLEVAFRLTKVYTTALHQFGVGSSIPINFKDLLVSCRLEFSKHEQEKAAKIDSANFILSPTVLAKDLPDLLETGSLENLIRKRHESAFLK